MCSSAAQGTELMSKRNSGSGTMYSGQAQFTGEGAAHGQSTARISPMVAHPLDHLLWGSTSAPRSSYRNFSARLSEYQELWIL